MNSWLVALSKLIISIVYSFNKKAAFQLTYFLKFKKFMNLSNPLLYNEKINWMKLNYRNELMPICADKFTVRNYVKQCGYPEILTNLLWQGYEAEKIPFTDLPDKFVIKVTHGSGMNIICHNKEKIDIDKTISKLNKWLKSKHVPYYGEWFYNLIKPRIIIEEFLEDDVFDVPLDYKLFCFNNYSETQSVPLIAIDTDRFNGHKRILFDQNWKIIEGGSINYPIDYKQEIKKPVFYEDMVKIASKLSKPFPHARIDFYVIKEKIYFGEITFMNDAGFAKIHPKDLERKMGDWIDLSRIT